VVRNSQAIPLSIIIPALCQALFAACFTPLLLLLLVVALAQRFQRTGHVEFLFIGSISLGFGFFIINGISLAMGEVGLLPPFLAGWAPLGIFLAIAGSVAFWHETHKKSVAESDA